MNIREVFSSTFEASPFSTTSSAKGHIEPLRKPFQSDTWITQDVSGYFSTAWTKIKRGVQTLTRWLKRIFCCCFCRKTDQEKSLIRLKTAQKELKRRLKQVEEGISSREAFQKWWGLQYGSLHSSVRELLLLEDVKLYAPESVNEKEWAKANIDSYRARAYDYVANLYTQREGRDVHDPLEDLPNFVTNVIHVLET